MSKTNRIIILIGLFIVTLVVTNPSEVKFLGKIGEEYGAMHHGASFSPAQLLEIGEGNRSNFIILSKYRYIFGNISVEYMGIGSFIFKTGVKTSEIKSGGEGKAAGIVA
jgi:hypothetical protein